MTERDTRNQQSDWNDRDRRDRDNRDSPRQPQQWYDESHGESLGSGQQGYDDRTRERDYGNGQLGGSHSSYGGANTGERVRDRDENGGARRTDPSARGNQLGYGAGYYEDRASHFGSFTSEEQGGRDFVSSRQGPYGGRAASYGNAYRQDDRNRDFGADDRDRSFGGDYRPRGYAASGRDYLSGNDYGDWRAYGEQRGFLSRAGDEIASWFGDDDATRRREQDHRGNDHRGHDHRGRGPANYTRSDERIREDVNDALTHDRGIDASHVTVRVDKGEVTLDGSVESREAKRRAEDAIDHISGVRHVQNNLRVNENRVQAGTNWNAGAGGSAGAPSTSGASAAATGTVTSKNS